MRDDFFVADNPRSGASGAGWERYLKCYSPSFAGKPDLEKGNKILLPQSALDTLARVNVTWPMLFEVSNNRTGRRTHCGVLEFIADEGTCNLPYWMMQNLLLDEGDHIRVANTTLPKGTFVKLQPVTSTFLEVTNPRAVLENALRHFATLTVGETIAIHYNTQLFEIEILELKPGDAVSIIETDINVDFAPPKDYVEPVKPLPSANPVSMSQEDVDMGEGEAEERPKFNMFSGSGNRLDGQGIVIAADSEEAPPSSPVEEEPWLAALAHGVRRSNPRFEDLVAKGQIKLYKQQHKKSHRNLFSGSGLRLDS